MSVPNLKEIAIAWARKINPTDEQMEIAVKRMEVCDNCEERGIREVPVTYYYCKACGCPLSAKVFSNKGIKGCPRGKWQV